MFDHVFQEIRKGSVLDPPFFTLGDFPMFGFCLPGGVRPSALFFSDRVAVRESEFERCEGN